MSHQGIAKTSGTQGDEITPLLRESTQTRHKGSDLEAEAGSSGLRKYNPSWRLVGREFLVLLRSSIPVILAYTLQNSLQTISVVVVGRRSPDDLAVAAFAYMFAMATAWLIALGGSTALDTLASASFTGSNNPHDLGALLQRGFIVLGILYVPVAALWFFSEPVFLALGQDPQISRDSARFLKVLIPGGLGYIYFEAMKKYLQAQGMDALGERKPGLIFPQRLCVRERTCWYLCHHSTLL